MSWASVTVPLPPPVITPPVVEVALILNTVESLAGAVVLWTIKWPFWTIPLYQLLSESVTLAPVGGVPVTVAVFVYWPDTTVPVAVQIITLSDGIVDAGKEVEGQEIVPTLLSTTEMLVKSTLPVFWTTYCQVTESPVFNSGPGELVTSTLFVFFSIFIAGAGISSDERCPTKKAEFSLCSSVIKAGTAIPLG